MCLAEQCCTLSRKPMRILQPSSPSGTLAPRSTECTTNLLTQKSVPTVGWIRVVPCQRVDFQLLLTQCSVQSWHSFARITTQALNSLPIWTIGTCGSNRSACYRQSLLSQQPPDRSILLCSPPRHRSWKGSCQDPIPPEFQDKVTLTLSCLGGHLQIHGDTERSLSFWVSRPPWRTQHNAFRKSPPRLQILMLRDSMCRQ